MGTKHKDLQEIAIKRLYGFGCSVFAKEVPTANGVADALGIKTLHSKDRVYYIECKASRSDLICEKQKRVYREAVGDVPPDQMCYMHNFDRPNWTPEYAAEQERRAQECPECRKVRELIGDTGIDYYYILVADGITVEDSLYPLFGVINERGEVVRKAKRMKRTDRDIKSHLISIGHVLVYKAYGKIYIGESAPN